MHNEEVQVPFVDGRITFSNRKDYPDYYLKNREAKLWISSPVKQGEYRYMLNDLDFYKT